LADEDRSSEDLTEEASSYRLEEFRRKGQVAQSRELSGLLALLGAGAAVYAMAPGMGASFAELMREVFSAGFSSRTDLAGSNLAAQVLVKSLKVGLAVGLPIGLIGFVLGALGSFAQIGTIFSSDPLTPDLAKLNPIEGMKKFFTLKHLLESFRMILKMIVVVAVSYAIAKTEVLKSAIYMASDNESLLAAYGRAGAGMFFSLIGVLVVFAAIDFGLQRWEYNKKLRLTKQEAKQEHKEKEGDPLIKSRIRAVQREMARRRMMQAVKTADVIVTNPTHFAVALSYQKDMAAPKVVAKGADFLAQKIKKIASDAGVPLVENVPLARTLYKTVKVGQYVPRALYQAVAEVLAYVFRLKNRKF
jgi:flagellar biosynthetic protein FlhB